MYKMTDAERVERETIKTLHNNIRNDQSYGPRLRNLAWGFVRGFKYRRIERSHRLQFIEVGPREVDMSYVKIKDRWLYEHNLPSIYSLIRLLGAHIPAIAAEAKDGIIQPNSTVWAWLEDRSGAIPVPLRSPKIPKEGTPSHVICGDCHERLKYDADGNVDITPHKLSHHIDGGSVPTQKPSEASPSVLQAAE